MGRKNERSANAGPMGARGQGIVKGRGGDGRRLPRVEREIREVIGSYLLQGFRGRLTGLVSISRVIVSGDLRQAKILVTFMDRPQVSESTVQVQSGNKADKKADLKELQLHAHEIQGEVNRRLQMRHCPRLTFIYDEGFEHAIKVDNILRELSLSRTVASSDDSGE